FQEFAVLASADSPLPRTAGLCGDLAIPYRKHRFRPGNASELSASDVRRTRNPDLAGRDRGLAPPEAWSKRSRVWDGCRPRRRPNQKSRPLAWVGESFRRRLLLFAAAYVPLAFFMRSRIARKIACVAQRCASSICCMLSELITKHRSARGFAFPP